MMLTLSRRVRNTRIAKTSVQKTRIAKIKGQINRSMGESCARRFQSSRFFIGCNFLKSRKSKMLWRPGSSVLYVSQHLKVSIFKRRRSKLVYPSIDVSFPSKAQLILPEWLAPEVVRLLDLIISASCASVKARQISAQTLCRAARRAVAMRGLQLLRQYLPAVFRRRALMGFRPVIWGRRIRKPPPPPLHAALIIT